MKDSSSYKMRICKVILLCVIYMAVCYLIRCGIRVLKSDSVYSYWDYVVNKSAYALVAICFLFIFGNKQIFMLPKDRKNTGKIVTGFYYCVMILLIVVYIVSAVLQTGKYKCSFSEVCGYICYVMLIGFGEEVFFRGLCFNKLIDYPRSRGEYQFAYILNGVLFGVIHFYPLLFDNDLSTFLVQMVLATFWGIVFACIYEECKNIWIAILAHGLYDFRVGMDKGVFGLEVVTKTMPLLELKAIIFFVLLIGSLILSFRFIRRIEVDNDKIVA